MVITVIRLTNGTVVLIIPRGGTNAALYHIKTDVVVRGIHPAEIMAGGEAIKGGTEDRMAGALGMMKVSYCVCVCVCACMCMYGFCVFIVRRSYSGKICI